MDLAAVLVGDEVAAGGAGVCAEDDAVLVDHPADGRAGLGHLGRGKTLLEEEGIPGKISKNLMDFDLEVKPILVLTSCSSQMRNPWWARLGERWRPSWIKVK